MATVNRKSPRNLETNPYSSDEARVAAFFFARGTGGGDDPIGSLLASYQYLVQQRKECFGELLWLRTRLMTAQRALKRAEDP